MLSAPLSDKFELVFGTSTGAIIAALIALGTPIDDIHGLYREHVPTIMRRRTASGRSRALERLAKVVFGERSFSAVKTGVGLVATHWEFEKPMIFKGSVQQAHGRTGTFVPGFGCTIAQAVVASCSAFPFFKRPVLKVSSGSMVEAADGGFCANNPTLYAIADATMALRAERRNIKVVSIGVGSYPEPKYNLVKSFVRQWPTVRLLQKTLNINTASMDQLRQVLFKDVETVRISDTFAKPEMATDLMEYDLTKLDKLYQCGRDSFAQHETALRAMLKP